jgi:benzoate/toluate 1,2-dioxygenase beta subunit
MQAQRLLHEEALALDEQRWSDWLDSLHCQVVFWVPAWRADHETTQDPQREVSLIHCRGLQALRDRVERVRSGRSPASTPMPRTVHAISNVLLDAANDTELRARSVFSSTVYDLRRGQTHTFVGRYEHRFLREGPDRPWLIANKRVVLANDRIPGMLDFYSV